MRWLTFSAVLLLSACSSSTVNILPPAELPEIEPTIQISKAWRKQHNRAAGEHYLKLVPAFMENNAYTVDYTGKLSWYLLENGSSKNEVELNTDISCGVELLDKRLFVGTSNGEVIALDAASLKILWRKQLSSEVMSMQGKDSTLVVRSMDGNVYALNASTGDDRWVYDRSIPLLTLRGMSKPVISNDIVIIGHDNGKLSALTLNNGTFLWESSIAIPQGRNELERLIDIDANLVVVDDIVYAVTYQGRLAAVQLSSGRIMWTRDFSSYSGMLVDGANLYLTDSQGMIWSLNRYNGSTLWRQDKLARRSLTAPVKHADYLVTGDFNGYLHWVNLQDGKLAGRTRLNRVEYDFILNPVEDDDRQFSKWNNILISPVTYNDMLIATDRVGHSDAFRIKPVQH